MNIRWYLLPTTAAGSFGECTEAAKTVLSFSLCSPWSTAKDGRSPTDHCSCQLRWKKMISSCKSNCHFASLGWTKNHRSRPVNHLQTILWKTVGHGLDTISDQMPRILLQGSQLCAGCEVCKNYGGRGHRRGENEHCGVMISLQLNCFGLSVFTKLNFRSLILPLDHRYPVSLFYEKCIHTDLYLIFYKLTIFLTLR